MHYLNGAWIVMVRVEGEQAEHWLQKCYELWQITCGHYSYLYYLSLAGLVVFALASHIEIGISKTIDPTFLCKFYVNYIGKIEEIEADNGHF